jgi:hypothetical protein
MTDSMPSSGASAQDRIERAMTELGSEGRWDGVCLFSSDGLLMARHAASEDEAVLLETALAMAGPIQELKKQMRSPEIIITGPGIRLAFRFFSAWEQDMILAVVIRSNKAFRRRLARLVRTIQSLD